MTHVEDVMIEELEGVFKSNEHTEDELIKKYDDLYKRVSRIIKAIDREVIKEYTMVTFTEWVGEYEHDTSYYYPRDYVNSLLDVDLINEFFGRELTQADSDVYRDDRYWDNDRVLAVSKKVPFKATDKQLDWLYKIGVYGDNEREKVNNGR